MSWKDDKDLGPWNFDEQSDKWGYLNNPRWSNNPKGAADPISATEFCEEKQISLDPEGQHIPCGHWHKKKPLYYTPPNLYGTGANDLGQLGLETGTAGFGTYYYIEKGNQWIMVDMGYYHSVAIRYDGTLWVTGDNQNGPLGTGDTTDSYGWIQLGSDSDWVFASCGAYFTLAIKSDGTLWATGNNRTYQLGLGHDNDVLDLTQIGVATNWVAAQGGYLHMVALNSDGELWGSGWNNYEGALGFAEAIDEVQTFQQLPGISDVEKLACGEYETLAIKTDGTLWGTGYNWAGMLGLGHQDTIREFTQLPMTECDEIACGPSETHIIKTDGTLWSCGYNGNGNLGLGEDADNVYTTFQQVGTASDWEKVFAGIYQLGVINTSKELWVCGQTGNGDFGIEDYRLFVGELEQVPGEWDQVGLGAWHGTIALNEKGRMWVSGANKYGPLGSGYGNEEYTLTLANDDTWDAVDCWSSHTLAIRRSDGAVFGTGYNSYGQLGFGNNGGYLRWRFTQLNVDGKFTQVACGGDHSLLFRDGQIWSAGYGGSGQLGRATGTGQKLFNLIDDSDWAFIAAGSAVSMAIKANGLLYSWGDNSGENYGQLGLGDTIDRGRPTECIGTGWKQVSIGS